LEGPLDRVRVKPRAPIEQFERMEGSWWVEDGEGYGWWEVDSADCDVLDAAPLPEYVAEVA
jgi:hypothetical protein